MGNIPVFLINNHRVESVADAEAYVARLREVERVMGEIGANMRHQTELGIVPPAFNFAPVREDGRRVLDRRAVRRRAGQRRSSPTSRPRWTGSQIPQAEKDRLIAAAREALTGPFRRGYDAMLATLARDRAARAAATTAPGACRTAPLIMPIACASRRRPT